MRKVYSLLSESGDSSGSGNFYGWVTWKESNPFARERKYRCNYNGSIKEGDKVTLYSDHDKSKIYKGSVVGIKNHGKEKNNDMTISIDPDYSSKNLGALNDVALISNKNNIDYTKHIECKFFGYTEFVENLKNNNKYSFNSYIYLIPITEHCGKYYKYTACFEGKLGKCNYTSDKDEMISKGTLDVTFNKLHPINIKGMKCILANKKYPNLEIDSNISFFRFGIDSTLDFIKGREFPRKIKNMIFCEVL